MDPSPDTLRQFGLELLPAIGVGLASLVVIRVVWQLMSRAQAGADLDRRFGRQLVLIGLCGVTTVLVVLMLPVAESTRNQLLALLGLVVATAFTLSSTTLVSNMMAGFVLHSIGNFQAGDFVRIGDQFGRVTVRGLFHVEIQTEDSDLTTLPNLYLISQPMTVVRSSGTVISASLSLGYDLAHDRVEALLVRAAEAAELQSPFTQILELGDFSVTYRVAGFLADPKQILSARSRLRRTVLDTLHGDGVEIVSPTFMNQRRLEPDERIVPEVRARATQPAVDAVEDVIFDKAEAAQRVEGLRSEHQALTEQVAAQREALDKAGESERPALALALEASERRLHELEAVLARADAADGDGRSG